MDKELQIIEKYEMIFYNFAAALYNNGQYKKTDQVLKTGLEINPGIAKKYDELANTIK